MQSYLSYVTFQGSVVVMIVINWIYNYLDNQCLSPLKVVSLNPTHGEVYSVQHL